MKYFTSLFIAILSVFVLSCSNDDDATPHTCYTSETTNFDEVTGPETTTVNTPITLNATVTITNGCGQFVNFIESNSFPKEIAARVDYTGCTCTDIVEIVTVPYVFQASAPGEYTLNFRADNGLFISKTITVTE